jgi:hypothetical protein
MLSKTKRKVLAELKQLKIRQKCVEKNISWPIKLSELEDDELDFLRSVERMKTENEKNYKLNINDAKSSAKDCLTKVHQFQRTIANYDEAVIAARPSELLKTMAEINILLSENLYICNKEMQSLKYRNDQCQIQM